MEKSLASLYYGCQWCIVIQTECVQCVAVNTIKVSVAFTLISSLKKSLASLHIVVSGGIVYALSYRQNVLL